MKLENADDSLSQAAAGAFEIACNAARKIENDPGLAEWLRELESLPAWRDDPQQWLVQLRRIRGKYRLPNAAEIASRTSAQAAFNRVCWYAETAATTGNPAATRQRELLQAGIFSGLLLAAAHGAIGADDAISAAFKRTGSQGGKKGNESRNKLKGAAFAFLTTTFPEIPLHRKGAPKGKPDAPKLAAALHKNPATSHLPGKTRSDWAKEWAKAREASQ